MPSGAVQMVLTSEIFNVRPPGRRPGARGWIVVRGDGYEGWSDGPHPRPMSCLRKLLEDGGRGVLLGPRPRLLESLGEGQTPGLVTFPALFVQCEHLLGDKVGQGGYNTLGTRTEPPPEIILRT